MFHDPKKWFFLDGLGALVSAVMLGLVLPYFQSYIGLPENILFLLAILPVIFASYSFTCYLRNIRSIDILLRTIAIANLCYVLITSTLIVLYFDKLTILGVIYFILEIMIILILVSFEWRAASSIRKNHIDM